MAWQLIEVKDRECVMDDSGVYIVIHRVMTKETHKEYSGERVKVRADLMHGQPSEHERYAFGDEIMSWIGTASAVRKAVIAYLHEHWLTGAVSLEHASYIGYELLRAEMDAGYVQD